MVVARAALNCVEPPASVVKLAASIVPLKVVTPVELMAKLPIGVEALPIVFWNVTFPAPDVLSVRLPVPSKAPLRVIFALLVVMLLVLAAPKMINGAVMLSAFVLVIFTPDRVKLPTLVMLMKPALLVLFSSVLAYANDVLRLNEAPFALRISELEFETLLENAA